MVKKFLSICRNQILLLWSQELTTARYSESVKFTWNGFTLILSSHVYLNLSSSFFTSRVMTKILYIFLISHMCYVSPISFSSVWSILGKKKIILLWNCIKKYKWIYNLHKVWCDPISAYSSGAKTASFHESFSEKWEYVNHH
jgi:hypothetical protein